MLGALWVLFIRAASWLGKSTMIRQHSTPREQKAVRARRKTLRTWLPRPRALASDTSLDRATGSPPVDTMISSE